MSVKRERVQAVIVTKLIKSSRAKIQLQKMVLREDISLTIITTNRVEVSTNRVEASTNRAAVSINRVETTSIKIE
jgi:hypothetical protein